MHQTCPATSQPLLKPDKPSGNCRWRRIRKQGVQADLPNLPGLPSATDRI